MFSGVGMFTAWDARVALGLRVEWVAVRESCPPEHADLLRREGKRVVVWEAMVDGKPLQGQAAVDRLGAVGWIGQDENMPDRQAALAAVPGLKVPWALVTNNHAPHEGRPVIPEAYWNKLPQLSPSGVIADARNLGGVVVSVCYGLYDASREDATGRRVPLADYLAENANGGDWCGYIAETMTDDDRRTAAAYRRPAERKEPMPIQLPKTFTPTHQTGGLPGYPAVDVFAAPGTVALAPEYGKIDRLSGKDPALGGRPGGSYGWTIYLLSPTGRYFLTHFGSRETLSVGDYVSRGQPLGTVCDSAVSGKPGTSHIHVGKNTGIRLPKPANPKRLASLRRWILARIREGRSWRWVKRTYNWREFKRLGGK